MADSCALRPDTGLNNAASPTTADQVVAVQETPRGVITLPTAVYDLIAPGLPRCLQRGDDDGNAAAHYPRLPLRRRLGDTTELRTRNVHLIAHLLAQASIPHNVTVQFGRADCMSPVERSTTLLGLTKVCQPDLNAWTEESWQMLADCRYGQVVGGDARQKYSYAALLCAAFPLAPVVLVVASRVEVEQVAAALEVRLQEPVHRAYGIKAGPQCRITIATYWAFRSEDLRDAPFIIVPNWRPGFPSWMKSLIWGPYLERLYFLRTDDEQISEHDRDGLFGRVGPVLIEPQATGTTSHAFSIYAFGGKASLPIEPRSVPVDRALIDKRKLYWRHRRRNQALAALAAALDVGAGPVSLLVETLEHAQKLSALLPGWPVIWKDSRPDDLPANTIVTLTAAADWPAFRPRWLVVSMGGPPSPWLGGWLSRIADGGHAVQIVDLTDGFDSRAVRLASARQTAYCNAGCHWRPLPKSDVQRVGRALRHAQRDEKRSQSLRNSSR